MCTKLKMAVLACCLYVTAPAQTPGSLKAHYSFSGNTLDVSGNSHNGQIVGNVFPVADRFGQANCSYLFPGDLNSYIEIPMTSDFAFSPSQSFSISLWYQGGSLNAGDREFFWGEKSNTSGYFFGLYDVNRLLFHECWAPMSSTIFPNPDTAWHHAVAVYDNGNFSIYRDTQLLSQTAQAVNPIVSPTNNIVIGRTFLGKIDDVRYYNEAIDSSAISGLYHMPGSCQPTQLTELSQAIEFNIYPNPASAYIQIDLKEHTQNYTIGIYSVYGRLIREINYDHTKSARVNIQDFPAGSYLFKISDGKTHLSKVFQKI